MARIGKVSVYHRDNKGYHLCNPRGVYLLDPYPALRTAHPVQFDDHRGPILSPRQAAHLALVIVMRLAKLPSASRTDQFAVPTLAPHP
jgi:hypothetical protein